MKCAWCGKEFDCTEEWAYKRSVRYFCSWKCLRANDMDMLIKAGEVKRSNARVFTFRGETHTVAEWSRISGIPYQTLYQRIYRGDKDPFGEGDKNDGR